MEATTDHAQRHDAGAPRSGWWLVALFVGYVAAGMLGERLALVQVAAIFWPPVGVLLAALLVAPSRHWWRCLLVGGLAELAWNALAWHNPVHHAVVYYLGNVAEVSVAAALIRRCHDGPFGLETVREFGVFVLAVVVAPTVGATVIATTSAVLGKAAFLETWPHAWFGDACGLLVATPLTLAAIDAWRRGVALPRATVLEMGVTAVGVGAVALFASRAHLPAAYAAMPLVLWVAFRFHLRGAAVAVGVLAAVTAALATTGQAGLSTGEMQERALTLQAVLGVSAILAVLVAALSVERHRAQRQLERLNAELEARIEQRTAELRERERELRAALAVASDVDRRKDAFLAMLGHELRNPLAPIRNATEWLARSAGDSPEVARVLPMMRRQVRQLVHLVDDLLDVARISQNALRLQRDAVDLGDVVEQAVESVQPLIAERDQHLDVVRPHALPPVLGDAGRLAQCVGNLLTNAAKYSGQGASIELAIAVADDAVALTVRDSGSGIAPELLPRIFEPFVQAPQTLERSLGGLGLGLALVRQIVELHGGTVTAESAGPGCGSTFTVRLPRATPAECAPTWAPPDRRQA